jgi:hypothetical protein
MNWFASLFQPQAGYSGTFTPDMSGMSTYGDIGIDPASTAFDSNMGTYDPASQYYDMGNINRLMPVNFGGQMNQQLSQQLAQLNQAVDPMQMQRGKEVDQAILSSLLDPSVALKAYRPTLI